MKSIVKSRNSGLTLTEVVVVLLMIGLLSKLAISSYSNLIHSTRIYTATSELHSSLLYARSESIKHGTSVVICRSSTAESFNPKCDDTNSDEDTNSGWGDGWIIYLDVNGDGRLSNNDKILHSRGRLFASPDQGSIIPTPKRKQIKFNSLGQVYGTYLQFAISRPVESANSGEARFICIASGGRARVDKVQCNSR